MIIKLFDEKKTPINKHIIPSAEVWNKNLLQKKKSVRRAKGERGCCAE